MGIFKKVMNVKTHLIILAVFLFSASPGYSDIITQFTPSVFVTGEYTDNYFRTEDNIDDEYFTIYGAEFSFGAMDQKWNLLLNYTPEYRDHNEYSENDFWRHDILIDASYQAGRNTTLTFLESYIRDRDQSVRNNSFNDHDMNETFFGIAHQFGRRNSFGVNYTYLFDKYDEANLDDFKTHNPRAFFVYWFSAEWGTDMNLSYSNTKYDIEFNDPVTWAGEIRLLHMVSRNLNIYAKYAHSDTEQALGDYQLYHPSVGIEWYPTEDSGITLGIGVLFQNWDITEDYDKERFFLDLDLYKEFEFTRRSRLSITGSSGYGDVDPRAASLGFNIYGELGFRYTYELLRSLASNISGAYRVNEYNQTGLVDRIDKTLDAGAGLVWTPVQWLSFDLSYSFRDFDTDAVGRDDYRENIGRLTIRLTPSQSLRFNDPNPRRSLESQVFTSR